MAKIEKDYNGQPIPEGYVLVPMEYNPLLFDGDKNAHENVRELLKAGRIFKVIYVAVPKEFAAISKSQFNFVQNEQLGHYDIPNSVSMDRVRDDFELEHATVKSTEEELIVGEEKAEKVAAFVAALEHLIEHSPQLGLAAVLDLLGKKGEEFAAEMGVTHNKANDYHNTASALINQGLTNVDIEAIRTRRSPRHKEYLKKAYRLLDELLAMLP